MKVCFWNKSIIIPLTLLSFISMKINKNFFMSSLVPLRMHRSISGTLSLWGSLWIIGLFYLSNGTRVTVGVSGSALLLYSPHWLPSKIFWNRGTLLFPRYTGWKFSWARVRDSRREFFIVLGQTAWGVYFLIYGK